MFIVCVYNMKILYTSPMSSFCVCCRMDLKEAEIQRLQNELSSQQGESSKLAAELEAQQKKNNVSRAFSPPVCCAALLQVNGFCRKTSCVHTNSVILYIHQSL